MTSLSPDERERWEHLSEEQRAFVREREPLWRCAHEIAAQSPGTDGGRPWTHGATRRCCVPGVNTGRVRPLFGLPTTEGTRYTTRVMAPLTAPTFTEQVNGLVAEYRSRCLWFLRPDYFPDGEAEQLQVLDQIARHGDLRAFRKASELRTWLLQHSSVASADS